MENKETQTEFRVGDKVWSFVYGWGKVEKITKDAYPVIVETKDNTRTYTYGGVEFEGENQSLFFDEIKFEIPKRPLPQLEVDTKVLVRNSTSDKWKKRYFSHFDSNGDMYCFVGARTSWSERNTEAWIYWKLAEDENEKN